MYQQEQVSFLKKIIKQLMTLVAHLFQLVKFQEEVWKPKFRLVDWHIEEETGDGVCKIQVIGKSQMVLYRPQEILAKEEFIYRFSPKDVCTISALAHFETSKERARISAINFSEEPKTVTLKYSNGTIENIALAKINQRPDIIEQLSKKDIFNLGRLLGDEDNDVN